MSSLNDHSHASLGHAKAINAEAPLRQPPDDWTMAGDDNDVLHIAPPSGLADTDMDMSFEVGTSHTELVRHKRHSLSGQNPRGNTPAPIAEEEASGPDDAAEGIRLFVDVPTVCGRNGAEPETTFQFTIKGLIALTPEMNASPLREEDLPISFALPVFRTPDIASQRCTIGLRATESLQHIGRVLEVARWPQLARPERGATHLQEVVLVDLAPSPPPVRPPPGHGFDPEACVLALRALALPHIAVESDVATLPSPQLLSSSIASDAISQDTLEPIDALRTIIASATVEVWPCKQQLEGEAGSRPRTVHRLTASWPSTKPAQAQDASLMSTCIIGFSHGRASVRTAQADLALPNPLSILGAFVNGRCISTEQQLPGESEQVIPALDAAVNQDTAAAASSTPYILQIPLPTAIDTGTSEVKLELLYALDTMEEQAGEIALPVFTAEVLSFRVDVHSPEGTWILGLVLLKHLADGTYLSRLSGSEELDVTTSDFRYVTSSGDIGRSNMTTLQRFNLPPLTVCVARLGTRKVDLPVLPVRETSPASVPSSSPARPSGLARVAQITAVPHLVWTVFITLFFAWVFVHLAQPLETLSRRVELVSMAVGVDDTDGSWQAGDVPGSEQAWEDTLKRAHHAGALAGWKSPSQFQTPDDWHRSNRNGQNAPSLTSPISGSWQAEEAIGSPASKAPIAAAASPEAASVTMPDRLSSKHQDDFPEFGGTQAPTELATTNINPLSALRELLLAPFTITLRGAGVLSAVLGRLLGLNS